MMMRIKLIQFLTAVAIGFATQMANAEENASKSVDVENSIEGIDYAKQESVVAIEIKREESIITLPSQELLHKKIYIDFKDSPKASKLIGDKLKSMGFEIMDSEDDADVRVVLNGLLIMSMLGKETRTMTLGEFLESPAKLDKNDLETSSSIGASDIIISGILTGGIGAVLNFGAWLLEKATPIKKVVNEAIAGDSRGFCVHKDCDKFNTRVTAIVNIEGKENGDVKKGAWYVESSAKNDRTVIDLVIADAIENALKPILALKSGSSDLPAPEAVATKPPEAAPEAQETQPTVKAAE